jgi:hypothetical protein
MPGRSTPDGKPDMCNPLLKKNQIFNPEEEITDEMRRVENKLGGIFAASR